MPDRALESPKRGRPAVLSRGAIVDAALAVGIDTLTMSSVATRLGVAKSSLYRWVSGRDELLGLVSDVVVERILPADPPAGQRDDDWRDWLIHLGHRMRREFLAVPGYATRIAAPHEHHSGAHHRLQQTVVATLTQSGMTAERADQTCDLVLTAVVGWLAAESHWAEPGGAGGGVRFAQFVDALVRAMPPRDPADLTRTTAPSRQQLQ